MRVNALRRVVLCASLPALLLGACADVKPWQKGQLARPEMAFDGDPLAARLAQHIYFSKENASGGYGVGGGGCGCN
jgi:hypothetical protein